ncbi:hypothetical protein KC334_g10172, partial [Hortaea werneckii]
MKSAATAWAAALAVMSISGPYTKAEAAPARRHDDGSERPKYYFPRHVKRQYTNTTTFPVADSPYASTSEPYTSTVDAATSSEPYAYSAESSPATTSDAVESEGSGFRDPMSFLESMLSEGFLPQTENTVVTTTTTRTSEGPDYTNTATYTITYTETSSPA